MKRNDGEILMVKFKDVPFRRLLPDNTPTSGSSETINDVIGITNTQFIKGK